MKLNYKPGKKYWFILAINKNGKLIEHNLPFLSHYDLARFANRNYGLNNWTAEYREPKDFT